MIRIKGLRVFADGKEIVKGIDLGIKYGEVHAIMGPNGSGKSTLSYALAGHPSYDVEGVVEIDGVDIMNLSTDKRAALGVFLSFQHPPFIEGVKVIQLLKKAYFTLHNIQDHDFKRFDELMDEVRRALELLRLDESFLTREVNKNFSGGEKKKAEMLQMLVLKPKFFVIDEVDSGLDVDALKIVARAINSLRDNKRAFLIITHYNRILEYVEPTHVHVMKDGKIVKSGGKELAVLVEQQGYTNI